VELVTTILKTCLYWCCAVVIVMLFAALHGDCGLEDGEAIGRCVTKKRAVIVVMVLVFLTFYVRAFGGTTTRD
jgi:hypothetical protein